MYKIISYKIRISNHDLLDVAFLSLKFTITVNVGGGRTGFWPHYQIVIVTYLLTHLPPLFGLIIVFSL